MSIMKRRTFIACQALRVRQNPKHPLYLFALTGDQLWNIASVASVDRDSAGALVGYQRGTVRRHVRGIVEYLDAGQALLPNSLVIALASSAKFTPAERPASGAIVPGVLRIPLPSTGEPKPGWIVDGQQRAVALSLTRERGLLVPVNAFIADDSSVQREQFLRVNSVKPLPRGLTTELLPAIDTVLPAHLAKRRAPSALCDMLNRDPESPFCGMIRRMSASVSNARTAIVSDTTVVQVIQDSLASPAGCLFAYRNLATGDLDWNGAKRLLLVYWSAVRSTFPEAWGLPPSRSRLMHSVGLRAMGRLMNRLMPSVDPQSPRAERQVKRELERIAPLCRWTRGSWEDFGLRWNELQNVPAHVRMLSGLLVRHYVEAAGE